MHIPDGYLGPKTCLLFYALMLPVWYVALRRAERTLKIANLPVIALSSSIVFVIMMLNFPIPGGSSGHVVGSALTTILLGPWVSVIVVSMVLFLQAILFGDGGITTYGANAFNMAFIMSITAYFIYGLMAHKKKFIPPSAFIAAYIAVNITAFITALTLGIQPLIEHDGALNPVYFPYSLNVTIPAMVVPHILFFAPVEGLITALIVSSLLKTNEELLYKPLSGRVNPLLLILALFIILTPLGILSPYSPWGEWTKGEFRLLMGYVPEGIERLDGLWTGIMPDYAIQGLPPAAGYMVSALLGSAAVVFIIYISGRLWKG